MDDNRAAAQDNVSALYVPAAYRAEDPVQIVRSYPFAQLISEGLHATATPLLLDEQDGEMNMVGHISRANPHAAELQKSQGVLAIFTGPHSYISPRSYLERPSVPTWNYVLAHVRGHLVPVTNPDEVLAILHKSVEHFEAGDPSRWQMEDAPPGKIDSLLGGIVTFRIKVTSIAGATKLSQIQPAGDRGRIVDELLRCPQTQDLGHIMRDYYADRSDANG